jgi:hypothetical protein
MSPWHYFRGSRKLTATTTTNTVTFSNQGVILPPAPTISATHIDTRGDNMKVAGSTKNADYKSLGRYNYRNCSLRLSWYLFQQFWPFTGTMLSPSPSSSLPPLTTPTPPPPAATFLPTHPQRAFLTESKAKPSSAHTLGQVPGKV